KYFEEWGERDDEITVFVQRERKISFHHRCNLCENVKGGFLPQLSACTSALAFRRAEASRAFSGGRNLAQLWMALEASVVVAGVVLQRNSCRVAAAFKPQIESLVGHRNIEVRLDVYASQLRVRALCNRNSGASKVQLSSVSERFDSDRLRHCRTS